MTFPASLDAIKINICEEYIQSDFINYVLAHVLNPSETLPLFNRIYFYLWNEVYAQVKHMKAY